MQAAALARAGVETAGNARPVPVTALGEAVPVVAKRQEVVAPRVGHRRAVRVVETLPTATP